MKPEETMASMSGQVAIVTGAASGIGAAAALALAREGVCVIVSDMDREMGERTVQAIGKEGGAARFVACDVSRPEQVEALVRAAREHFGKLDVAVNNAGIGGEMNPTGEYSIEGWHKVIAVNLSGVFYCMKYEIRAMLEAGGGSIVNVASILGQVGFAGTPAYTASKHGVVGLTRAAALEYSARNIRVNAVGPAFIHTPMIARLEEDPQQLAGLIGLHPIGRVGRVEEVAELILWLASPKASFVTGSYYPIDGAYLAR